MKARFVTATTWVMSENSRIQAVLVGTLIVFGLIAGLANPSIALADGSAPGGSR